MGTFHFSMEKVLDWRSEMEEKARRELTELQNKKQQQELTLQKLIQENTGIKNETLKLREIQSLRYSNYYKLMLDEKIIKQKLLIDQTAAAIEKAQEHLVDTHRDKKAMEKLKEKEHTSLLEQEKYQEQLQLDEIATMAYARRAR